ncbi:hypothetical protein [Streptomyces sp. NPDC102264]|uniref:hypothetical protein n=1 Tax=Streptomyces sp. NPDC102264 TaxID=3366149 RepID=UPI0037FFC478
MQDEPTRRRYEKLIDRLESLMRAALKPEYQGYYGRLILVSDDLAETASSRTSQRAAREAGRRLGWKPITRLAGGRLFVIDKWKVPEEIEQLAEDAAAEAMDRASRDHQ